MIDIALLRRAWPTGLQRRGVQSISGWRCFKVLAATDDDFDPHGAAEQAWWENIEESPNTYSNAGMERDDMLPDVDPTDTATWACCLADIVAGAWPDDDPAMYDRVALRRIQTPGEGRGMWRLVAAFKSRKLGVYRGAEVLYNIEPTDDPALALVRIRIAQREEAP